VGLPREARAGAPAGETEELSGLAVRAPYALLAGLLPLCAGASADAQEVFRCTGADGRVTYQQAPCPKGAGEQRIDATPANPDYDPGQRQRILEQGEEAGRKLEARAAEEEKRRREAREREERLEREAQEREAAREPAVIYGWPVYRPVKPPPRPPRPPAPPPVPAPRPSGR
jgi:hypothetical protein